MKIRWMKAGLSGLAPKLASLSDYLRAFVIGVALVQRDTSFRSGLRRCQLLIDLYIIHDTHAVIPAKAGIQWV